MKKFLSLMLALLMIVAVVSGCNQTPPAEVNDTATEPETTEDTTAAEARPMEGEHLVIAINAENAPMESIDASGEYVGFSIDLTNELAERLGFTYEYSDMDFFGLINSLTEGRCDMILSSISATEERKEIVDFSDGYYINVPCIITTPDSGITSVDDLAGKKVGGSSGTLYEQFVRSLDGVEALGFDSSVPAMEIIGTGELDAHIESSTFAENYAYPKGLVAYVIPKDVYGKYFAPYAIAFPKGNEERVAIFNAALAEIQADGTMEALNSKWFSEDYVAKVAEFMGE